MLYCGGMGLPNALARTIRATRANHALEHATIEQLLRRHSYRLRVVGRSFPGGFDLYGDLGTDEVTDATHEALARLKGGEGHLAVSPYCGTNLAVAAIFAGLAGALLLRGSLGVRQLPKLAMVGLGAALVAQPLGRIAQEHVTTSAADAPGLRIRAIRRVVGWPLPFLRVDTTWNEPGLPLRHPSTA